MAKNKAGRPTWFKFWQAYRRQLDIEQLSLEARGRIFTNIMRYFDGAAAELLPMGDTEAVCFNIVKVGIDDSFAEYDSRSQINRQNGLKGGKPKETEKTQSVNNNRVGEKIEVKKKEDRSKEVEKKEVDEKADKPPRSRFIPPTVEQVAEYCRERDNGIDAERFVDYYTARGWIIGKGKMKDWRAAVRTWERNEDNGRCNSSAGADDTEERIAGAKYII